MMNFCNTKCANNWWLKQHSPMYNVHLSTIISCAEFKHVFRRYDITIVPFSVFGLAILEKNDIIGISNGYIDDTGSNFVFDISCNCNDSLLNICKCTLLGVQLAIWHLIIVQHNLNMNIILKCRGDNFAYSSGWLLKMRDCFTKSSNTKVNNSNDNSNNVSMFNNFDDYLDKNKDYFCSNLATVTNNDNYDVEFCWKPCKLQHNRVKHWNILKFWIFLLSRMNCTFYVNQLPWISASMNLVNSAWLYETAVKKSKIENAGVGRFAIENIPMNNIICKQKIVAFNEIGANCDCLFNPNLTIKLESLNQIKALSNLYMKYCPNAKLSDILIGFESFLWGFDGCLYLMTQSGCINTSNDTIDENILIFKHKDCLMVKSLKIISKNEELIANYKRKKYFYPSFYFSFCKEMRIKNMDQILMEIDKNEHKAIVKHSKL